MAQAGQREEWGSRIGLILAAAGNAIGIGNLLRFPGQAGANGGGAFMIPYVISLIVFGLPMMWVAWTIGRIGGRYGHGSTPGMFDKMSNSRFAKYFGVLGLALPLIFVLYYTYIEAWCLGYSWFSLTGDYISEAGRNVDLRVYYDEFLGNTTTHSYFPGLSSALTFLLIALVLNVFVLYRGVARGIEMLAKIAIPLLALFCLVLIVRIFSIGDSALVKGTAMDGLAFLWTPDFSTLTSPSVWLAAAGQIFFTLSIGFGSLECYSSYVKQNEDIALTGLTTASSNEFVEIIFGSMIAIPAAALFFGAGEVQSIASSGTYSIGMVTMPEILRSFPGAQLFGTIWFLLLFFAAFTSSVGVAQPVMAFLQDELKIKRGAAAMVVGVFWLLGTIPVIYFYRYGVLDEMDFWSGTIGLVVMALIEVVLFAWVFKIGRSWEVLHQGAQIQVPRFFKPIINYVTPIALIAILVGWMGDAVSQGKLIPQPRLAWDVMNRSEYTGNFIKNSENDVTHLQRNIISNFEGSVSTAVTGANRDLTAYARIQFPGDGTVRVVSYEGDPKLAPGVTVASLQSYLNAKGFHYEVFDNGAWVSEPGEAMLAIEGLNRAPYIWLIRIIIVALIVAFSIMVHVIWKERRLSGEGGTA
jgi:NSS family neurotransmitter:Na+ symporter